MQMTFKRLSSLAVVMILKRRQGSRRISCPNRRSHHKANESLRLIVSSGEPIVRGRRGVDAARKGDVSG